MAKASGNAKEGSAIPRLLGSVNSPVSAHATQVSGLAR